ncbi:MAG: FAD-dependent oxidoreductase [Pseudomonadota bacterium]
MEAFHKTPRQSLQPGHGAKPDFRPCFENEQAMNGSEPMGVAAGVIIVGAGQAGLSAAMELRKRGFADPITLIGDEAHPPYQRPPLSKSYLSGETPRDRLWLKPDAFYQSADITLQLGRRVVALDRAGSSVVLDDGGRLQFDHLILAAGGSARRPPLPGADQPSIPVLRTMEDADQLAARLQGAESLIILGAGYIGLEVAASARKRGLSVTVLEASERPLARTASTVLSSWFGGLHRGRGVDLRVNTPAVRIIVEKSASGVELADGEIVTADRVMLATGLKPNTELAEAAGLACDDGVLVDAQARTEDERIFAVGDLSRLPLKRYGRRVRLESVQNAIDQARVAAAAICGAPVEYDPVPWFWSDQYEIKLQIAGLTHGATQIVRRGDPEMGRFALFHLAEDGRLLACEAIDSAPEYMAAQRMIAKGVKPDAERLRDPAVAMRDFLS